MKKKQEKILCHQLMNFRSPAVVPLIQPGSEFMKNKKSINKNFFQQIYKYAYVFMYKSVYGQKTL